jgi:hypothetical protein
MVVAPVMVARRFPRPYRSCNVSGARHVNGFTPPVAESSRAGLHPPDKGFIEVALALIHDDQTVLLPGFGRGLRAAAFHGRERSRR